MAAMDNILELLAGSAGWNQNARLLTLSTPAGAEALLAETARIDEALGPVSEHAGFRIELTVLAANAHHSLTALLGQPARLCAPSTAISLKSPVSAPMVASPVTG